MQYAIPYIDVFLAHSRTLLFVPFARPGGISHEDYTELFRARLEPAGYRVQGLGEGADAAAQLADAEAVFVGGGNTFVLLRALYDCGAVEPLRERVAAGMPYLGSSAGSNVAGRSIATTNDMPIVYPPTFEGLGLVPFNINPHYLDPDPDSTHMGETRATRIKEFHAFNPQPVIGLREGSAIEVYGGSATLLGTTGARLFRRDAAPEEHEPGSSLDALLEDVG